MVNLERSRLAAEVRRRLKNAPAVMLLGPRQCGKTTLARELAAERRSHLFDLESPVDVARLEAPMTALERLRGLVIIDEAQLMPELFPVLRVLTDRKPLLARFLLLGSASPELASGVSESLAGRVSLVDMGGFDLDEVGTENLRRLWWRGSFPRSYLARSNAESERWRADFLKTFLERDLRRFDVNIPTPTLRRFWTMVAHYHGQLWNASELGRSLGQAHTTIRRHLDILSGAFVVRVLPPWFENLSKRQVKSPKIYVRDSGLLHTLLGISSFAALESHPKLGASWEGFALEEVLRLAGDREAYFWHTQGGAELDLLLFVRGKRYGIEFKYVDAPRLTKSLRIAHEDLGLEKVLIVYPGKTSYSLESWCDAIAIVDLHSRLGPLLGR